MYMGKKGHSHKLPEIERCCQILIPVFRRSTTDYRPYYDSCDMNQKLLELKSDMLSMNEVYRLRPHYLGILCQSHKKCHTKIYVSDTHIRYHDKLYSLTTLFIDLSIFRIFLFDNFPFILCSYFFLCPSCPSTLSEITFFVFYPFCHWSLLSFPFIDFSVHGFVRFRRSPFMCEIFLSVSILCLSFFHFSCFVNVFFCFYICARCNIIKIFFIPLISMFWAHVTFQNENVKNGNGQKFFRDDWSY